MLACPQVKREGGRRAHQTRVLDYCLCQPPRSSLTFCTACGPFCHQLLSAVFPTKPHLCNFSFGGNLKVKLSP